MPDPHPPSSPFAPFGDIADAHLQTWLGLVNSAAAVASLPVRTLAHVFGAGPLAPQQVTEARLEHAEGEAARLQTELEAQAARARQEQAQHQALVAELRRGHEHLERSAEARATHATDDQKRLLYERLEPLLTQLPLLRHALAQGQAVEASDVLALLGPLDDALAELGFRPIGRVGEAVAFEPSLHQVSVGAPPEPGTPVTVKQVGFTLEERVLRRARVSRPRPVAEPNSP